MSDTPIETSAYSVMSEAWKQCAALGVDPKTVIAQLIEVPVFSQVSTLGKTGLHMPTMPIDDLVAMYIAERNQLAADRHAYEEREARLKEHMQAISGELLDRGDKLGVESFRTSAGTAYKNVKRSFTISKWDDVVNYVKETSNFQILQKRLSPNSVREIEETDGKLPPGIEPFVEIEFSVRSPVARKSS